MEQSSRPKLFGNDQAQTLTSDDLSTEIYAYGGNDTLTGGLGDDLLDGGTGADLMAGGAGNDIYIIDNSHDDAFEDPDPTSISAQYVSSNDDDAVQETAPNLVGGIDTVLTSVNHYTLEENIENLTQTGDESFASSGNDLDNVITGNAGNSILYGGSGKYGRHGGNDRLDGGLGEDTLIGEDGDDTYVVNSVGDVVIEERIWRQSYDENGHNVVDSDDRDVGYYIQNGIDTIETALNYTLNNTFYYGNIENLTLTGTENLTGTGNDLDNVITGNDGNNALYGGLGKDTIFGGLGQDTLYGGVGDDLYVVDNDADEVIEDEGSVGGTDTVKASINYSLGDDIENLTLTGTENLTGTGNKLDNVITGNDGNNVLYGGLGKDTIFGGLGQDTLYGGVGDDVYMVDDAVYQVFEADGEGNDSVKSSTSVTLWDNIETLELLGSENLDGTGNDLDNRIVGNDGSNRLDGGLGNDMLVGGAGDDTYVVDSADDVVWEFEIWVPSLNINGEPYNDYYGHEVGTLITNGIDTVEASCSFTLGNAIENLTLLGTDNISGTGNTMANEITGNDGANTLDGGEGDDKMIGSFGSDTLYGGGGQDSLFGGTREWTFQDESWSDPANEPDTLVGGAGSDSYFVENRKDLVIEYDEDGENSDTVYAFVSYTLPTYVEHLTLFGLSRLNGTGNAVGNRLNGNFGENILKGLEGDDQLSGNSGNDTLFGGEGSDWLDGGEGDDKIVGGQGVDFYVVDDVGDVVIETAADVSRDTVYAKLSYILPNHVENLTLWDHENINGTGNSADNDIYGNNGANVLQGRSGNDTLMGGYGDDTLYGGDGNDEVSATAGNNALYGGANDDTIVGGIGQDMLFGGTGNDKLFGGENNTCTFYGGDGDDTVTGGAFADMAYGGTGNDTIDGDDGENTLYGGAGDDKISGGIENDTLDGGTGNDTLTGGAGQNVLQGWVGDDTLVDRGDGSSAYGGAGNDHLAGATNVALYGGVGNDTLEASGNSTLNGGAGNDRLIGGSGADVFVFDSKSGTDQITGFTTGSDHIKIAGTLAALLGGADALQAGSFYADAGAVTGRDADDRLVYNTSSGALYYDADGSGIKAAVQIAVLDLIGGTRPTLTFEDFIFS